MPEHVTAYGAVSWLDKLRVNLSLLTVPFALIKSLLLSPFVQHQQHKPWGRVLSDSGFRYVGGLFGIAQVQYLAGTTRGTYEKWMKAKGLEPVVDEIGDNARLLWIGEKRTEKVIMYIHGGVYCFPVGEAALSFWKYATETVEKKNGQQIGLAVLNYSLVPEGYFPTPFKQTVIAVQYLISSGVQPQNLQIVGDSAGGALILQLFSHILHPFPEFPVLSLPTKIKGAHIMAPWVSLTAKTGSYLANSDSDVLSAKTWASLGDQILYNIPDSQLPYIDASLAPQAWFSGINSIVDRILVSVGNNECLRDDVVSLTKDKLSKFHDKTTLFVQNGGVHNDVYFNFEAGLKEEQLGELTQTIVEWLAEGFKD
ncbi:Alpha/Beta hydrolase protein [Crucibulum laeve]|uniref:Alpha/Beta hydrolase protein n=1 Tax=Crucibulum laeve TaxID=68775 RepID=A0A5C3LMT4_9AGAR|nr:Alpha/Beta hydrolase protein [Crucibulum laeve]